MWKVFIAIFEHLHPDGRVEQEILSVHRFRECAEKYIEEVTGKEFVESWSGHGEVRTFTDATDNYEYQGWTYISEQEIKE